MALERSPDSGGNSRLSFPFLYRAKHAQGQGAGKWLEIEWTMWPLILGLLHEKPAQRFRPLIDRKEVMPVGVGDNLEKPDLFGHLFEKTGEKLKLTTMPAAPSHSPKAATPGGDTKIFPR